jgi:hypothetical protein
VKSWKNLWNKRLENWKDSADRVNFPNLKLPTGKMQPIGYLCQQHSVRMDRPVKAYDRWVQRIPEVYRESVLEQTLTEPVRQQDDIYCLATIKHYRSLIPMGQEYRKPIFNLTSADGAIGAHANAVQDAKREFKQLALKIANQIGMTL